MTSLEDELAEIRDTWELLDDSAMMIGSQAEIARLLAAVEAVLAEHKPHDICGWVTCSRCASWIEGDAEAHDWPCPTVQAITTALGVGE